MLNLNTLIIILVGIIILGIGIGVYFLFIKKKPALKICKQIDDPCSNDSECCGSNLYSMYCNDTSKTCTKCPSDCKDPNECCNGKQCVGGLCQDPPKVCGSSGSNCPNNNEFNSNYTTNKGDEDKNISAMLSSNCKYLFVFDSISLHDYSVYKMKSADISDATTSPNFFHTVYEPNYKAPSFGSGKYMNFFYMTADGDLYIKALKLDGSNKTEILWSASSRNDGMWSKGTGPPYTLTLDDCGNLVLTDSSNNITFTSKLRYFCDIDGTNCRWRTCNNDFKCGFTDDNKYWCKCT